MAHPPIGHILDTARGIGDTPASSREHIDTCAACRRTVETMRGLAEFTAREGGYEAPPAAVALAEAIFPAREKKAWSLTALAAQLVYDSARDPLPAGARSRNAARQFLYEAGSYSLVLHVTDECSRRDREAPRVIVVGQISDRRRPEKAVPSRPVELRSGDELVAQAVSNPLGEFHVESGRCEALKLRVGAGRRWIEVPVQVLETASPRGSAN